MARRLSSVCLSVNLLRKSPFLPDKWSDCHQTCTQWSPEEPASRVCSSSRSRWKVTYYRHIWIFKKSLLTDKWLHPDQVQFSLTSLSLCPFSFLPHLYSQVTVSLRSEWRRTHGETVCKTVCYTVRSHILSTCAHVLPD